MTIVYTVSSTPSKSYYWSLSIVGGGGGGGGGRGERVRRNVFTWLSQFLEGGLPMSGDC